MENTFICKICGNRSNNRIYDVKERIINKNDVFKYSYCPVCGTLSRVSVINDMSRFYGGEYYAYKDLYSNSAVKGLIKKITAKLIIFFPWSETIQIKYIQPFFPTLSCLCGIKLPLNASILDIGGGAGLWLRKLMDYGYRALTNVDLFAPEEFYEGITFIRGQITDVPCGEGYDLITLHHSFEHMDDPDSILQHAHSLLKNDGLLLIRIPVMENIVWEKYHTDWYQIDAPRHAFLYTENAMNILCGRHNLCIEKVIYDSVDNCLLLSQMYADTSLSLSECVVAGKTGKKDKREIIRANLQHKGDQACFYIRKK